jgi:arsenate reductase
VPVVVFACIENSFRSQLAEALFNAEAPTGWRAVSGGSRPGATVNPVVHELLAEIGVEHPEAHPKPLVADLFRDARYLVTMGCGEEACPPGVTGVKHIAWEVSSATGRSPEELRQIRDGLWMQVRGLIERAIADNEREGRKW